MKNFIVNGHSVSIYNRIEVDDYKWDNCVLNSVNTQYYALASFLDCISDEWAAFVWADYKAVMPIPFIRKFGLRIIAQPVFCQQLGLYSTCPELLKVDVDFLKMIKDEFIFLTYSFNVLNELSPFRKICKRRTFQLSLNKSYEDLYSAYSKNHKKNVKRAAKKKLILKKSNDFDLFAKMYKRFHQVKNIQGIKTHNVDKFLRAVQRLNGKVFFVADNNENPVLAAYVIKFRNTYTFLSGNTDVGYHTRARYFFIDQLIQLNSKTESILDFAGSNIESIAEFNKGFGSEEFTYPVYENKKLQLGVKLLKKIRVS